MTADLFFSVDLEDVRCHVQGGHAYPDRVRVNTERYLGFMEQHRIHGTFFVVGTVAEHHPELIREIVAAGHEVACHTHTHVQLDRHTPESLRDDLQRNKDALLRCGATEVVGFRAPTFSLTAKCTWVYDVLAELGFKYSTSVLPTRNPLYGWPEFGSEPRMMGQILELPITVHPWLGVPLAGGVYFRVLPFPLIAAGVRKLARRGGRIHLYLHPYDLDTEQDRFEHSDLAGNRLYNALMYVGRARVLPRLDRLLRMCRATNYRDSIASIPG